MIPKIDGNFIYIDTLNPKLLLDKFIHDSSALNYTVVWKPNLQFQSTFYEIISDYNFTRIDTSFKVENIAMYTDFKLIFLITNNLDLSSKTFDNGAFRDIGISLYKKKNNEFDFLFFKERVFDLSNLSSSCILKIEFIGEYGPFLTVFDYCNARDTRMRYYSLEDFHLVFEYAPQMISNDLTYFEDQEMINKKGDCFDIKSTISVENASTKTSIKHYTYNEEEKIFE